MCTCLRPLTLLIAHVSWIMRVAAGANERHSYFCPAPNNLDFFRRPVRGGLHLAGDGERSALQAAVVMHGRGKNLTRKKKERPLSPMWRSWFRCVYASTLCEQKSSTKKDEDLMLVKFGCCEDPCISVTAPLRDAHTTFLTKDLATPPPSPPNIQKRCHAPWLSWWEARPHPHRRHHPPPRTTPSPPHRHHPPPPHLRHPRRRPPRQPRPRQAPHPPLPQQHHHRHQQPEPPRSRPPVLPPPVLPLQVLPLPRRRLRVPPLWIPLWPRVLLMPLQARPLRRGPRTHLQRRPLEPAVCVTRSIVN